MDESEKKIALGLVNHAHEIARRLYSRDKHRYDQLFGWIGEQVKKRRSLDLIVRALRRVEEMELRRNPPQGPIHYLGGILRNLEEEREAKRLRRGEPTAIGEILERVGRGRRP